jgi:hypothetical protein
MNNACPNCLTVYTLSANLVGRRTTCKTCGASLFIETDGFRLVDTATAPGPPPTSPSSSQQLVPGPSSTPTLGPRPPLAHNTKPFAIVLTAVYFAFGAVLNFLGYLFLSLASGIGEGLTEALGPRSHSGMPSLVPLALFAILCFIVAILQATACYGLFTLQTWSYPLTRVVAGLGVAVGLFGILASPSRANVILQAASIACSVTVLLYFAQPHVRALFPIPLNEAEEG